MTPRIRGRASPAPALGFTLLLPEGTVEEPTLSEASPDSPTFRAVERRGGDGAGRLLGRLDVSLVAPSLIVDRDGVLVETVSRVAAAMLASPRDGHATTPYELALPCGRAWRSDVILRERDGIVPALPYVSAIAIGHPDLRRSAALLVLLRAAHDGWRAAAEVLDSLRFAGYAPRISRRHVTLPMTF